MRRGDDKSVKRGKWRPRRFRAQASAAAGSAQRLLSPMDFLRSVMDDPAASSEDRVRVAVGLLPYVHYRHPSRPRKRDLAAQAVKEAATGVYAPRKGPPRLIVDNALPTRPIPRKPRKPTDPDGAA